MTPYIPARERKRKKRKRNITGKARDVRGPAIRQNGTNTGFACRLMAWHSL